MPCDERVYWFDRRPAAALPRLRGEARADVVVVGGGIAGLSAAKRLMSQGARVVVVEAGRCGRGATGRSSGFITPDSELQVADLDRRLGQAEGSAIYRSARAACSQIRDSIDRYGIDCDLLLADSLYAAGSDAKIAAIREEHRVRLRWGLPSALHEGVAVGREIGTTHYPAAVQYDGTFAIDGAAYAIGLRDGLRAGGLLVYEESPAVRIDTGRVETADGVVCADRVVVCIDRWGPDLGVARRAVWRAAAYLLVTEPLTPAALDRVFPSGPRLVWDTDLVYQYLRPTPDGRLLVGGGVLANTFARVPGPSAPVHQKIARFLGRLFPELGDVAIAHRWHGLIGVTKDVLPLAGAVPGRPGVFCALASAGLPWATLAGQVAAEVARGAHPPEERLLDPARAFTTVDPLQPLLGKEAMWMLSNVLTKGLERGGPAQVARRQRVLGLAAAAGLVAGAAAGAWRWRR